MRNVTKISVSELYDKFNEELEGRLFFLSKMVSVGEIDDAVQNHYDSTWYRIGGYGHIDTLNQMSMVAYAIQKTLEIDGVEEISLRMYHKLFRMIRNTIPQETVDMTVDKVRQEELVENNGGKPLTRKDITKLISDIFKEANEFGIGYASATDDNGAFNFDAPVLVLKNWKQTEIEELSRQSGVSINTYEHGLHHIWSKQWYHANKRTAWAEGFCDYAKPRLKKYGIAMHMYYKAD